MAMICKECGGIIPDVSIDFRDDLNDCKHHKKREADIQFSPKTPLF